MTENEAYKLFCKETKLNPNEEHFISILRNELLELEGNFIRENINIEEIVKNMVDWCNDSDCYGEKEITSNLIVSRRKAYLWCILLRIEKERELVCER